MKTVKIENGALRFLISLIEQKKVDSERELMRTTFDRNGPSFFAQRYKSEVDCCQHLREVFESLHKSAIKIELEAGE